MSGKAPRSEPSRDARSIPAYVLSCSLLLASVHSRTPHLLSSTQPLSVLVTRDDHPLLAPSNCSTVLCCLATPASHFLLQSNRSPFVLLTLSAAAAAVVVRVCRCAVAGDSKVDASKVIAEVSGKHDLKHVAAPSGGLSAAEKEAYLAEKQGKK